MKKIVLSLLFILSISMNSFAVGKSGYLVHNNHHNNYNSYDNQNDLNQKQGQKQGQAQGQIQGQAQGQYQDSEQKNSQQMVTEQDISYNYVNPVNPGYPYLIEAPDTGIYYWNESLNINTDDANNIVDIKKIFTRQEIERSINPPRFLIFTFWGDGFVSDTCIYKKYAKTNEIELVEISNKVDISDKEFIGSVGVTSNNKPILEEKTVSEAARLAMNAGGDYGVVVSDMNRDGISGGLGVGNSVTNSVFGGNGANIMSLGVSGSHSRGIPGCHILVFKKK